MYFIRQMSIEEKGGGQAYKSIELKSFRCANNIIIIKNVKN